MQDAMPSSDFKDIEGSGKAPRVRRLDPTKKTVPDVFYYKPSTQINKPKLRQPAPVKPIFTGAELDALANGLANNTLEPTLALVIKQCSIPMKNVDLKEFTCFGRLPIELRLKVWKHARPDPRLVRLVWSKEEPKWVEGYLGSNLHRYNYSPTPIPGILHACAESRQVALGWYRLGLAPYWTEPRTYFDFSADYLYIACESCETQCCEDCNEILSYGDSHQVQRLLFPWPYFYQTPFLRIFLRHRRVKEVLIFNPETLSLKAETQLVHLKETTKPFNWQNGKDLHAMFLEEKDEINSSRELEMQRDLFFCEVLDKVSKHVFYIEKITRVELAITSETSKVYGFMEKEFKNETMSFDFRSTPS